jgi:V8-like Glu-specific endopeptidase
MRGAVRAILATWCAGGFVNLAVNAAADPFIETIANMKRSVSPLVCLAGKGSEASILDRLGSAFFITEAGDFLTAAHVVLEMQKTERPCPVSAILVPRETWRNDTRAETATWFAFTIPDCVIDEELDVAKCRLIDDHSVLKRTLGFKITPVQLDAGIPPDGTQVAFTGFPLGVRDPMTSRAGVATFRNVWQDEKPLGELVLDRTAWPGSSGSPVYLSDGRVIGVLIRGGTGQGTGWTALRPVQLIRKILAEKTNPQ